MTCIVGLVQNGRVTIGGDSAGVDGLTLSLMKQPKVFFNGSFLMGYTSSFRFGQILEFVFKPPAHDATLPVYEYMVAHFIPALRECLKTSGYGDDSGQFLVGYSGRLFGVQGDYAVLEFSRGYDSCGCGVEFAAGSLFSTNHMKSAFDRVSTALKAAADCSAGVSGPFVIRTV